MGEILSRVFCLTKQITTIQYNQITSKQIKNWAELKTSVTNHSTDANLIKYQNQGSNDGTPPNQKLVANSVPQFYQFKWESDKMVSCLQAPPHNHRPRAQYMQPYSTVCGG